MSKKLISIFVGALILCGAVLFSGCSNNNSKNEDVSIPSESQEITDENYENNIAGLQGFMKDRKYIKGEPKTMSASFIGAKEGYRYDFAGIITELYEFDLSNLNSTAKDTLDSIRDSGSFVILDEEIKAVISKNGKYIMIYTDNSNRENKDERENVVKQGFESFKENE